MAEESRRLLDSAGASSLPGSPQPSDDDAAVHNTPPHSKKWRDIIAFWIFGMTNNYPYVIMLSAALDIIVKISGGDSQDDTNSNSSSCTLIFDDTTNTSNYRGREPCKHQGTSIILLADILPTFFIKLIAPYFMQFIPYWIRLLSVVGFSLSSFVIVAMSNTEILVLFGVVNASISSGFGEIMFLSMTAWYHKSTISAWASGTGAAGVFGAVVYAALKTSLSPKTTLLIQLFIPVVMLLTYIFLLGKPKDPVEVEGIYVSVQKTDTDQRLAKKKGIDKFINRDEAKFWLLHVRYCPHLFKYMLPLFLVYFAEYSINQGFFELLYNANTHLWGYCMDQFAQYRWLQVIYQIGVLISRSSLVVVYIRYYWLLSLLQVANFVFFFFASIYLFIPSFWLTFFIILYEGLLGGAVYVNVFYTISKEVPAVHREFSMGAASIADSTGICVAGLIAILIHKYICTHFIGYS